MKWTWSNRRNRCRNSRSPAPIWKCRPDFKTACAAWIYAGGAHHTGFSYAVTTEHMEDFAEIAGVELAMIDQDTKLRAFQQQLRDNEIYYHLAPGLGRL